MKVAECAFCEKPSIRERKIVENELAWAFPTNAPIVPGHVLVVPKRCVATFAELSNEERDAIFTLRDVITQALGASFEAEGFNYAWNEGVMAGQSVPHFHLHILPRKTGDTGIFEYEPRQFLYRTGSDRAVSPEEELAGVSALIRKHL